MADAISLLRLNRNFETESSNMADYDIISCSGEEDERECDPNSEGFADYAEAAVGLYVGINIIGLVAVLIGTVCFILYLLVRCCMTCCGCHSQKKASGETVIPSDEDAADNVEYISTRKPIANPIKLVCGSFAVLGIVIMCIVSNTLGNNGLTEESSGIVNAPAGIQRISQDFEPKLTQLVISISSGVVVPTMLSLNRTINDAIDIPLLTENMLIINESIPELPDVGVMLDVLYNIDNITTGNITSDLVNELGDLLEALDDSRERAVELVDLLQDDVDAMASANEEMLEAIDQANETVIAADDFCGEIIGTDEETGVAAEVHSDLTTIQRSPAGTVPSVGVFDEASNGEYGSTSELLSGDMNGNSSNIQLMNERLTLIYANMSSLPNYSVTAMNIVALNESINEALSNSGILSNLTDSLLELESSTDSYPDLSATASYVNALYSIVQSVDVDLDTALDILEQLDDMFNTIPSDLAVLYQEVEAVRVVSKILSAFEVLTDQLLGVNETLVKLPSSLDTLTDVYSDINETTSELLDDIDDILDDIVDANETVVGYLDDAEKYLEDINEMDDILNTSLSKYDFNAFNDTINDASEQLQAVNFSSTLNDVNSLRGSLEALSLSNDLVDALRAFQIGVEGMVGLLRRAVDPINGGPSEDKAGDYLQLAGGYCSDDSTVICDNDTPCFGSCVGKGTYRCSNDGSTPCSSDSNCSVSGSYCLVDFSRAADLHVRLRSLSSTDSDIDVSSELDSLDEVLETDDVDFDAAHDAITSAENAVTAVNLTDVNSMLSYVEDGLDQFNITGAVGELDYDFTDLGITDIIEQLEPVEDDVADLSDEYHPIVRDYSTTMIAFRDFMFTELQGYINNLSSSALNAELNSRGPNAMIKFIVSQFDSITHYFDENQDGITVKTTSFRDDAGNSFKVLDKMGAYEVSGYGDIDKHGATYYFLSLLRNKSIVQWNHPMLMGVFVNSDYEKYEDGDVCVTEKCEDHTMEVLNSAPLSDWDDEFPDLDLSLFQTVDYTREELLIYLWLAPLCIAFLGFLSLVLHAVQKCTMAEKITNGCYLGCILCQLPFLFLLTAFFFALAIVISDGCNSWSAIGESYITSYGDPFCENSLGGDGTLRECSFDTNIPDSMGGGNITATVDIISWYRGIFANDCSGRPDPFATLLRSLADQTRDIPAGAVDHVMEDNELNLRDALLDIMDTAAADTGTMMHNFFDSLADEVLTCEKVAGVIASVDRETCDSFAPPIFWIIAPWYLCAWIICCLGIPSACMRAKMELEKVSPEAHVPLHEMPGGEEEEMKADSPAYRPSSTNSNQITRFQSVSRDDSSIGDGFVNIATAAALEVEDVDDTRRSFQRRENERLRKQMVKGTLYDDKDAVQIRRAGEEAL